MNVSIIIPTYNEDKRLVKTLKDLAIENFYEIIVIDDCSTVSAENFIKESEIGNIILLRNDIKLGYIKSIKKGILKATGDIIVTMDADGEHKSSDIKKLIEPIENGNCDIVYGKRPNIARYSEILLLRLTNLFTGEFLKDAGTGFRAIRSNYAKNLQMKGKCTCGMLHLECHQKKMNSCEVEVQLPIIAKPRKIGWGHFAQTFILIFSYLKYKILGVKI